MIASVRGIGGWQKSLDESRTWLDFFPPDHCLTGPGQAACACAWCVFCMCVRAHSDAKRVPALRALILAILYHTLLPFPSLETERRWASIRWRRHQRRQRWASTLSPWCAQPPVRVWMCVRETICMYAIRKPVWIHICMCVHIHTHIHNNIHTFTHTLWSVCVYAQTKAGTQTVTSMCLVMVCMQACTCVAGLFLCAYVHTNIYLNINACVCVRARVCDTSHVRVPPRETVSHSSVP